MTRTELAQPKDLGVPLVVSVAVDAEAAVVTLRGEADRSTLPVVVDALARAVAETDGPVIVDLAQTTFIDAGTLRAMARAADFLDRRGRTLVLRSPSRIARRIVDVLDLSCLVERDLVAIA
jgi:anti-anti-sigma factor